MNKMLPTQISVEVDRMIDATNQYHDSYAFTAGYLGSLVTALIADLPQLAQREVVRNLQDTARKYTQLGANK